VPLPTDAHLLRTLPVLPRRRPARRPGAASGDYGRQPEAVPGVQAALCPQGEKYPILPGVRRTKDPPQQARVGGPEQGQTLEKAAAEKAGFPGLFSGKTGAGNHFPRQPTKRIYFFYFSIQTTPARDGVSRPVRGHFLCAERSALWQRKAIPAARNV